MIKSLVGTRLLVFFLIELLVVLLRLRHPAQLDIDDFIRAQKKYSQTVLKQRSLEVCRIHGRAEKISLTHVTAQQAQHLALLLGFHALGDGLQAQALGHVGDRSDDGGGIGIAGDVVYKGLVYLYGVHRQLLEIAQR